MNDAKWFTVGMKNQVLPAASVAFIQNYVKNPSFLQDQSHNRSVLIVPKYIKIGKAMQQLSIITLSPGYRINDVQLTTNVRKLNYINLKLFNLNTYPIVVNL